jgi:hypothetical protein
MQAQRKKMLPRNKTTCILFHSGGYTRLLGADYILRCRFLFFRFFNPENGSPKTTA